MDNKDLGKTQITPKIRLSSAAIYYEHQNRYQVETWVFSDDKSAQRSRQFIHGSDYGPLDQEWVDTSSLCEKARTFHRRASRVLLKKHGEINN